MTDLRARRVATQLSQGFPVTISGKEMRSYHKKMLELLQEREERSKGCVWCEYFATAHLPNEPKNKFIYCPMCGWKLKTATPGEDV